MPETTISSRKGLWIWLQIWIMCTCSRLSWWWENWKSGRRGCTVQLPIRWSFQCRPALYRKSNSYIPRKGTVQPQSQLPTFMCLWAIYMYIPRIGPHISLQQNRQTDSQIYECRNWETEHYSSVLEIMRLHSFISGNTLMGHLYLILIGPSFAVRPSSF